CSRQRGKDSHSCWRQGSSPCCRQSCSGGRSPLGSPCAPLSPSDPACRCAPTPPPPCLPPRRNLAAQSCQPGCQWPPGQPYRPPPSLPSQSLHPDGPVS